MPAYRYGKALANLLGGESAGDSFAVDFLTDTIRLMLTTSSYAYNLDTHETKADVTNEVTGAGYTARGAALASKTIVYTTANSWATAWATGQAKAIDAIVRPAAGNGALYRCTVAGTTHASTEPTWPTVFGSEVLDNGTLKWAHVGRGITQIDAADVSWSSSTITARYGVIYKDTGTDGTSPLLFLLDFGSDIASTNATFTVQFDPLGIFYDFSR